MIGVTTAQEDGERERISIKSNKQRSGKEGRRKGYSRGTSMFRMRGSGTLEVGVSKERKR